MSGDDFLALGASLILIGILIGRPEAILVGLILVCTGLAMKALGG